MVEPLNQNNNRVGVEICGAALYGAVIGPDGELVSSRYMSVPDGEATVPAVVSFIDELKSAFGPFDRIGVAVPGLVDRKTGRVAFSANIPQHTDVIVVDDLEAATGLRVSIENDANAAGYGEFRLGAGRDSQNLFYATLGAGVGGAFIFGGEIWRGASGFAGEFGYVPINSEGTRLEDVASAADIIRRTRERFHQDSTSSLNVLSEEAITVEAIISAAQASDDFAQMMLERTGVYVGTAIASVINLLNIEKIVIGGQIMQAKNLVLDAIVERARELSFAPSFASTSIVEGELGMYAAAVGAAFIGGQAD